MNSLLLTNKGQLGSRSNRGSIVIFVVLMMPLLLGIMGIALDMGKLFVVKSELQNAADACALAAAYELDGTGSQFTRAESAGISLAIANRTLFQKEAVAATADASIQFSTTASGGYTPKGGAAATAGFVRCRLDRNNIDNWFVQLLGFGNQNMSATAVAANRPGQNTCAIPVGVCEAAITGKPNGTWLKSVLSPSESVTGEFNWVDLNIGGGAKTLAELLTKDNACFANPPLNTPIGQSGYKASVRADYNSRFGVFANSVSGSPTPDVSGKGYYTTNWTINTDAYNDYLNNKFVPYSDIKDIDFAGKPTIYSSTQLQDNGKNRRLAVAPVVDCTKGNKLKGYACVFMLHPVSTKGPLKDFNMYLEYLGNASSSTTPCNQSGLAGNSNGTGPRVAALVQ